MTAVPVLSCFVISFNDRTPYNGKSVIKIWTHHRTTTICRVA